jgi:hypothetical protein
MTFAGHDVDAGLFHAAISQLFVIARSAATKQSILSLCGQMDCFASLAKMGWTAPDGINVPDW